MVAVHPNDDSPVEPRRMWDDERYSIFWSDTFIYRHIGGVHEKRRSPATNSNPPRKHYLHEKVGDDG